MSGIRLILSVVAALIATAPAHAQLIPRKPRLDTARVRYLSDTLRADPDEKKRRAALGELKEIDPRMFPEVLPAVVTALQRDTSAAVRADAAVAIGGFKVMVPIAGVALEAAAESDPSPAVRDAAQQALWEYHLIGYRSAKGADGIAGQTDEPQVARPRGPRPMVAVGPPIQATDPPIQPVAVNPRPRPPVDANPPQPVIRFPVPMKGGIRVVLSAAPPAELNATAEPQIARQPRPLATDPLMQGMEMSLPPVSLPPDRRVGPTPVESWAPPRVLPVRAWGWMRIGGR